MFKNKSAWFSQSVNKDIPSFWVSQGGVISNWKTAGYLFSSDASCADTKRIHASDDYVMGRVTVFHSTYLTTCKARQSAKYGRLGCYLLPPVPVQTEVRARFGRFIWEQDELQGQILHENGSFKQNLNVHSDDEGSPLEKEKTRQENCMYLSPPRDETVCCEIQLYPVNNMVSGYPRTDQLKKYSGELRDFFPSRCGCSISYNKRHACQHNI